MLDLKEYRVRILCEDRMQGDFLRGIFEGFGVNVRRKVEYPYGLPEGAGSGEAFVIGHLRIFAGVAAKNRENIIFVVAIDADTRSFEEQEKRLYREMPTLGDTAKRGFFMFIPKRNIETWIAYCRMKENGEDTKSIDEITDYKQRGESLKPKKYGIQLAARIKNCNIDCENLPALQKACAQFSR